MRLPLFIARRYFFSRRSQRAVNIISMISVTGISIGTAALIVVLSVFNGFEDLILRLYNSFDPDIKIEAASGKRIDPLVLPAERLLQVPGVQTVCPVVEENCLVRYRDRQYIATMKGVGDDYARLTGIDTLLLEGNFVLDSAGSDYAVVGGAIAYTLQLHTGDLLNQLEVYAPKREAGSLLVPEEAFNRRFLAPSGVFAVQQEYDEKYVIVPIGFAREILEDEKALTSYEIGLKPGADKEQVTAEVKRLAGDNYRVRDREAQHALLHKIMRSEKWAVFLILTFILIIATFNMVASLTMLVIEKREDIAVLHSLGADLPALQRIFLLDGLFITLLGCGIGMVPGFVVCYLQERFGLIGLGGSGAFVIDSYPVKVQLPDAFYVFLTVLAIGFVASWYPARKLVARSLNLRLVAADE